MGTHECHVCLRRGQAELGHGRALVVVRGAPAAASNGEGEEGRTNKSGRAKKGQCRQPVHPQGCLGHRHLGPKDFEANQFLLLLLLLLLAPLLAAAAAAAAAVCLAGYLQVSLCPVHWVARAGVPAGGGG